MSIADGHLDPVIAARAKLQIGRSGRHIAQEAIQLHGGIGGSPRSSTRSVRHRTNSTCS
jgi:alkylation response protein AidB-like acyl-CoA dehydrogenase